MPTPLPRSVTSLDMNSPAALAARPDLAARIGIIAVFWAELEQSLDVMLASILGIDMPLCMSIYFLSNQKAATRHN